ncbi:MAG: hypothetical protein HFJ35_06885 [Clostridia bacterium]|nr:hypothetical protein [Clostridia bacterium]
MKAKKGILYLTLCIISTMLLLGWYVARIHEIIEFNEKILVSLQTYAEQESEGLIYIFQVDSEARQWSSEISCDELAQNRLELRKRIFLNYDAELGVEKGTMFLYINQSHLWWLRVTLIYILVFGGRLLMLYHTKEWDKPLIKVDCKKIKDRAKNISKALATNLARNSIVRRMVTYKQKFKK